MTVFYIFYIFLKIIEQQSQQLFPTNVNTRHYNTSSIYPTMLYILVYRRKYDEKIPCLILKGRIIFSMFLVSSSCSMYNTHSYILTKIYTYCSYCVLRFILYTTFANKRKTVFSVITYNPVCHINNLKKKNRHKAKESQQRKQQRNCISENKTCLAERYYQPCSVRFLF